VNRRDDHDPQPEFLNLALPRFLIEIVNLHGIDISKESQHPTDSYFHRNTALLLEVEYGEFLPIFQRMQRNRSLERAFVARVIDRKLDLANYGSKEFGLLLRQLRSLEVQSLGSDRGETEQPTTVD